MSVVIIFTEHNGKESELMLIESAVIGRSSKADFTLDDSKISGKHCKLVLTKKGSVEFTDLNSTNGSFLGNAKISGHQLKVGEKIKIGDSFIHIDEKRLSPQEKLSIGYSKAPISSGLDLPSAPAQKNTVSIVKPKAELKQRDIFSSGSQNVFEKEDSSGQTKMLKIEKPSLKKKK